MEQARLQNRDLRSSPGRRMPDGWTRQRPRTAMPESREDSRYGDSPFVGFVWFVVTILSSGSGRGRSPRRVCCGNQRNQRLRNQFHPTSKPAWVICVGPGSPLTFLPSYPPTFFPTACGRPCLAGLEIVSKLCMFTLTRRPAKAIMILLL